MRVDARHKANVLVRYDAMCRAIDAAYKIDEVKSIHDSAVALEMYARQAHNVEAERQACEIRLRAERKAGALSKKLAPKPGTRTDKQPHPAAGRGSTKKEQLAAAGISLRQSERWEALAGVADDLFEEQLADKTHIPTTNGIIRATAVPKVKPVADEALWLWGRLLDFERDHCLLKREPAAVLATMTPEMLDDVHTLAPRVAAWLKRIGELVS